MNNFKFIHFLFLAVIALIPGCLEVFVDTDVLQGERIGSKEVRFVAEVGPNFSATTEIQFVDPLPERCAYLQDDEGTVFLDSVWCDAPGTYALFTKEENEAVGGSIWNGFQLVSGPVKVN